MRLELRSEMVDFGHFCQAFINQEMYAYGSGSAKFGSKCTQNGSELKTREPFFFHSPAGGVGQFFSYGAVGSTVPKGPVLAQFHASGDQLTDFCTQVGSEFTGDQRFLYSRRIGVGRYFRIFQDRSSIRIVPPTLRRQMFQGTLDENRR